MSCLDMVDVERLEFARLVTETARRTGGRTIENVELIGSGECMWFVAGDVGGEAVIHAMELPPKAWSAALEAELVKLFQGSAQLALRQLPGVAA